MPDHAPQSAPPVPVPSASVILVDPARGGDEPFGLFLLQRRQKASFMPNRFVFPGGRSEPSDGPDPWADGALRNCALRELWEEAGVALCQEPAPPAAALEGARRELMAGRAGLLTALAGLGLTPDQGALMPYARWITPTARPQRFDTMFYVARMPAGQEAICDALCAAAGQAGGQTDSLAETSQGLWLGPRRALAKNTQGRVELAPPQVVILGHLAELASVEELAAFCVSADLSPVLPVLWARGKGPEAQRLILLPWDPDYPAGAPADPDHPGQPCPASQASRLVHHRGVWGAYRPGAPAA
jgi:ADP-ribose pyrophosphatase YjhB (NUDIX family)